MKDTCQSLRSRLDAVAGAAIGLSAAAKEHLGSWNSLQIAVTRAALGRAVSETDKALTTE